MNVLAETVSYMTSTDYKERFIAEYEQLDIRLRALQKMLQRWDAGELDFTPTCPRETYDLQCKFMKGYRDILIIRANMEKIDLC